MAIVQKASIAIGKCLAKHLKSETKKRTFAKIADKGHFVKSLSAMYLSITYYFDTSFSCTMLAP